MLFLFVLQFHTARRYSISLKKVHIVTGKLLIIPNQIFSCELNSSRAYFLRDISYLLLRLIKVKFRYFVKFTFAHLFCSIIFFCSIILKFKFKCFVKFTFPQLFGCFQGERILKSHRIKL